MAMIKKSVSLSVSVSVPREPKKQEQEQDDTEIKNTKAKPLNNPGKKLTSKR
jgi:hypothetical protein